MLRRSTRAPRPRDRRTRSARDRSPSPPSPLDRAAREQQVLGGGLIDAVGQQQDAAGANTPSFISGCPNCASGAAKIGPPASASSSPPPRHWPRTATRIGAGNSSIARIERVQRREHRRAAVGQMLLDARAEAEMRPLGVEQHAAQARSGRGTRRTRRAAPRSSRRRRDWPWAARASGAAARRRARPGPSAAMSPATCFSPCPCSSAGSRRAADPPSSRRRRASGAAARSRPRGRPSRLR